MLSMDCTSSLTGLLASVDDPVERWLLEILADPEWTGEQRDACVALNIMELAETAALMRAICSLMRKNLVTLRFPHVHLHDAEARLRANAFWAVELLDLDGDT